MIVWVSLHLWLFLFSSFCQSCIIRFIFFFLQFTSTSAALHRESVACYRSQVVSECCNFWQGLMVFFQYFSGSVIFGIYNYSPVLAKVSAISTFLNILFGQLLLLFVATENKACFFMWFHIGSLSFIHGHCRLAVLWMSTELPKHLEMNSSCFKLLSIIFPPQSWVFTPFFVCMEWNIWLCHFISSRSLPESILRRVFVFLWIYFLALLVQQYFILFQLFNIYFLWLPSSQLFRNIHSMLGCMSFPEYLDHCWNWGSYHHPYFLLLLMAIQRNTRWVQSCERWKPFIRNLHTQ